MTVARTRGKVKEQGRVESSELYVHSHEMPWLMMVEEKAVGE